MNHPLSGAGLRACLVLLALSLVTMDVHAGGPPRESPEDERAREQYERRIGAQVKTWRAQGTRVLPILVKIACGADAKRHDMIAPAADVLEEGGAASIQAIYAYKGPCAQYDPAQEGAIGVERARLLSSTYCRMAGRYTEPAPANARALAEWGALVVDDAAPGGKHELAVEALENALEQTIDACDTSTWVHLLPKLKEAAAHLPLSSWRNVSGTHHTSARTARDRVVIAALGASTEATATLVNIYDASDLQTKALVLAALERSGSAGAPAFAKVIDFMRLTRDDELRFLAVRTLFAIDVVLARDDAERTAEVLGEWLPRVRSPKPSPLGSGLSQPQEPAQVWAALGAEYATRVLARALARSDSERVRVSLQRVLAAPLERGVRSVAAQALIDERTGASSRVSSTSGAPDDLKCAKDTLAAPKEPLPLQANSMGGFAPSWTPPASCARVR